MTTATKTGSTNMAAQAEASLRILEIERSLRSSMPPVARLSLQREVAKLRVANDEPRFLSFRDYCAS